MAVCKKCLFGQNWAISVGDAIRTFARKKNLIWDLLQATKAEIIQSLAILSCLCKTEGDFVI